MDARNEPIAKDLFSKQSRQYAISRPRYPRELFDFIVGLVSERCLAWDCATGNGQAAIILADYFGHVIANDISAKQIENAQKKSNITFQVFPAENTPLEDNSVDLITIAQTLHWFNFDKFYCEAKRVLKKPNNGKSGGIIAAWTYGLHTISSEIDKITHQLSGEILGETYWPPETKFVEAKYESIPFPFEQITPTPKFQIELRWDLTELIGYLRSWSSIQLFIEKNGYDPISTVIDSLEDAWGGKDKAKEKRKVVFPLYLKVGKT